MLKSKDKKAFSRRSHPFTPYKHTPSGTEEVVNGPLPVRVTFNLNRQGDRSLRLFMNDMMVMTSFCHELQCDGTIKSTFGLTGIPSRLQKMNDFT